MDSELQPYSMYIKIGKSVTIMIIKKKRGIHNVHQKQRL